GTVQAEIREQRDHVLARVRAASRNDQAEFSRRPRGAQRACRAVKNASGDAGRYSRSFGLSASIASPPCGEWKAYRVTAAIARNSIETHETRSISVARSRMAPRAGLPRDSICKKLDCQTSVTADTDAKSVSCALANRQPQPGEKHKPPTPRIKIIAARDGATHNADIAGVEIPQCSGPLRLADGRTSQTDSPSFHGISYTVVSSAMPRSAARRIDGRKLWL